MRHLLNSESRVGLAPSWATSAAWSSKPVLTTRPEHNQTRQDQPKTDDELASLPGEQHLPTNGTYLTSERSASRPLWWSTSRYGFLQDWGCTIVQVIPGASSRERRMAQERPRPGTGDCVEVASLGPYDGYPRFQGPTGRVLVRTGDNWTSFLAGIAAR